MNNTVCFRKTECSFIKQKNKLNCSIKALEKYIGITVKHEVANVLVRTWQLWIRKHNTGHTTKRMLSVKQGIKGRFFQGTMQWITKINYVHTRWHFDKGFFFLSWDVTGYTSAAEALRWCYWKTWLMDHGRKARCDCSLIKLSVTLNHSCCLNFSQSIS